MQMFPLSTTVEGRQGLKTVLANRQTDKTRFHRMPLHHDKTDSGIGLLIMRGLLVITVLPLTAEVP